MEENNTKAQADGLMLFAGEAWFDPIEVGIWERVCGIVDGMHPDRGARGRVRHMRTLFRISLRAGTPDLRGG